MIIFVWWVKLLAAEDFGYASYLVTHLFVAHITGKGLRCRNLASKYFSFRICRRLLSCLPASCIFDEMKEWLWLLSRSFLGTLAVFLAWSWIWIFCLFLLRCMSFHFNNWIFLQFLKSLTCPLFWVNFSPSLFSTFGYLTLVGVGPLDLNSQFFFSYSFHLCVCVVFSLVLFFPLPWKEGKLPFPLRENHFNLVLQISNLVFSHTHFPPNFRFLW